MSVVHHLAAIEDPTSTMPSKRINKSHPEFKELFGWIYRGVVFALVCTLHLIDVSWLMCQLYSFPLMANI